MDRSRSRLIRILHAVKFGRGNVLALGAVAVILAALVTLAACVDEPTATPPPTVPPTPTIAPTPTTAPVPPTPIPTPDTAPTPEPTPVPAVDRSALVSFYLDTGGDNWESSRNRLSMSPIGEWYGVSVDGEGRVTGVELRANGLNGEVPEAL